MASGSLTSVKVEQKRRHTQGPAELHVSRLAKVSSQSQPEFYETQKEYEGKKRSDFVYVNAAYVGSRNNVNDSNRICAPPTSVVREQYWACSKWPFGQRILAIAVGLLVGTVIGLVVIVIIRGTDHEIIPPFLRSGPSVPD